MENWKYDKALYTSNKVINPKPYYYFNSDHSWFYNNPDESRYYNNGKGYSGYKAPGAERYEEIKDGFIGMELDESTKRALRILEQPPEPEKRATMIAAMEKAERQKAERARLQAERERQRAERENGRVVEMEMGWLDRLHMELTREKENVLSEEREEREKAERQQVKRERAQRELETTQARTETWSFMSSPGSSSKRSAIDLDSEGPDLYGGTPTPTKRIKNKSTIISVVDLTQDDDSLPSQEFLNTPSSLPVSLPIRARIAPPKFGLAGQLGQNAVIRIESQASQDPFV